MKRDLHMETTYRQEAAKVPGLQRKVKKLGDLAAKMQRERDNGRNVTSRLLIENTRLRDALRELCACQFKGDVCQACAALSAVIGGTPDA